MPARTALNQSIFWHVYPLAACGAAMTGPHQPAPRLRALLPWVDYAAGLGCTGLLLGPIFQSTDHGYDTVDHFHIDDRLGGDAEFAELVSACARWGLDLILDGVFNHVGAQHPYVSGDGPVARTDDGQPVGWEGDGTLALLDHADPRTEELVVDVMCHWLSRGITGWRLGVAYAVPTEFWHRVISRVRERFPDAVFLGEMIHGDYPAFAQASDIDTMTQYELWKAIWSSLTTDNFWELDHAIGRHREFSAHRILQTFISNHDVDRIASAVGRRKAELAAVALMCLPGIPSIYYGDERGVTGTKGEGVTADFALRPFLGDLPAESQLTWIYRQLIALRKDNPWVPTGEVEVADKTNQHIRWLVRGDGHELECTLNQEADGWARVSIDGEQRVAL